ncbi:hypothetical protein MRX96_050729 [Rhipicephalus microplus]
MGLSRIDAYTWYIRWVGAYFVVRTQRRRLRQEGSTLKRTLRLLAASDSEKLARTAGRSGHVHAEETVNGTLMVPGCSATNLCGRHMVQAFQPTGEPGLHMDDVNDGEPSTA